MDIIIETPRGSHDKLKYDLRKEQFIIIKTLPEGLVFPFDFGFVPQTRGEDGDPLDILILSASGHPTGTQIDAHILGCLPANQTDKERTYRNDRFVGVPADSEEYDSIRSIEQLPEGTISAIQSFFSIYLAAENKKIDFLPVLDARQASQLLQLAKS
ncbi:MAG: inorganic diphosphatase [Chitinophagaceae bacterium]|nr:inorganic diphosphatase [Chitinophagaceae bacterium]